jgi:hypothetical protein
MAPPKKVKHPDDVATEATEYTIGQQLADAFGLPLSHEDGQSVTLDNGETKVAINIENGFDEAARGLRMYGLAQIETSVA